MFPYNDQFNLTFYTSQVGQLLYTIITGKLAEIHKLICEPWEKC